MQNNRWTVVALMGTLALPSVLLADREFSVRRANAQNLPAGTGQCDIRVHIDQQADVYLGGTTVFVDTLRGAEARDGGSECTMPVPAATLQDFRMEKVSGRGDTQLVSPPTNQNGWRAIVRVDDPGAGSDLYHFRLTWNATAVTNPWGWNTGGSTNTGGWNTNPLGTQNISSICQDAIRNRMRQEFSADLVFQGGDRTWQLNTGATAFRGVAQARARGQQRQVEYTCVINNNNVQTVDYRFLGNQFGWVDQNDPRGTGAWNTSGRDNGQSAVRACQQEIRQRLRQAGAKGQIRFPNRTDWWGGPGGREFVQGTANINSQGERARFEFRCEIDPQSNRVESADYRILSGNIGGSASNWPQQ